MDDADDAARNKCLISVFASVKIGKKHHRGSARSGIPFYSIFKIISLSTPEASNIFELFSIFVAAFFTRNVTCANGKSVDGAWAASGGLLSSVHSARRVAC
jgi:hypothetical protein